MRENAYKGMIAYANKSILWVVQELCQTGLNSGAGKATRDKWSELLQLLDSSELADTFLRSLTCKYCATWLQHKATDS